MNIRPQSIKCIAESKGNAFHVSVLDMSLGIKCQQQGSWKQKMSKWDNINPKFMNDNISGMKIYPTKWDKSFTHHTPNMEANRLISKVYT